MPLKFPEETKTGSETGDASEGNFLPLLNSIYSENYLTSQSGLFFIL